MKARWFTLTMLFLGFSSLVAQSGWYWQNPLPQGNRLEDAYFFDLYNGWAVGEHGTILFTNDQGESWIKQKSGTTDVLYAVWFQMADDGWAVGQNGTILHWDGVTWEAQESNFEGLLYDVHFITSQIGWVVGQDATVLHTVNGGETWSVLTTDFYAQHYFSVCFLNENEGYLAGAAGFNGVIKYTNNGGTTWSNEIIPANRMNAIWMEDLNSGWAVGDNGALFHKSGAEGQWTLQSTGSDVNLTSVHALNPQQVWVVGEAGSIFHSNNEGVTWFAENSQVVNNLNAVFILDGESGWTVGDKGDISHTLNGGGTWTPQSLGPTGYLRDISFNLPGLGVVVGDDGVIYRTYDEGETWVQEVSNTSQDLYALDLAWHNYTRDVLVAVGYGGTIMRKFWEPDLLDEPWQLRPYDHAEDLYGIDMRGSNGWVAGHFGSIARTENFGKTWEIKHQDLGYHLYDIQFPSPNYGWAVGMSAKILHSEDTGESWTEQISPVYTNFNAVYFCDLRVGWAVGLNGTIIHTVDGGRNWTQQNSGTTNMLTDVFFTDENNGWVAGNHGTILHTSNGGNTWAKQISGTSNLLFAVYFSDPATGWVCGEKGTILHTLDGGGTTYFQIYPREDIEKEILDLQTTEDVLTIEEPSGTKAPGITRLVGLEVNLEAVEHTAVGDLTIMLSHDGVTDTLMHQSGDEGDNIIKMRLSDAASVPIDSASVPFTGSFEPYKPLSAFSGLDPYGDWTLRIYDSQTGNTGRLQAWSLKLFIGADEDPGTGVGPLPVSEPTTSQLLNYYPNPVRGSARIEYLVPHSDWVELSLFNLAGQKLKVLVSSKKAAGVHEKMWDASGFDEGIYILQIKTGSFVDAKKVVVAK